MALPTPKAIIFDWDNTLIDSWPIISEAYKTTLESFGKDLWSADQIKENVHRSVKDSFPDVFGQQNWQKAKDIYMNAFLEKHIEYLAILDKADRTIESLRDNSDVYLAIVSNKQSNNLRKEIEYLGWQDNFVKIIGAGDAEEDKPSIAPVKMALADSGIELNENVWFVGDSLSDLACAHNGNLTPIWFSTSIISQENLAKYPPAYIVKNHTEFYNLLKQENILNNI
ncbi:MAG: HAD family hydrolase [Pseudomonadota bacterium]